MGVKAPSMRTKPEPSGGGNSAYKGAKAAASSESENRQRVREMRGEGLVEDFREGSRSDLLFKYRMSVRRREK